MKQIKEIISIKFKELETLIKAREEDNIDYIRTWINLKSSKEVQSLLYFKCDITISLNVEILKLKIESIYPVSILYDNYGNIINVIQFKNEKDRI